MAKNFLSGENLTLFNDVISSYQWYSYRMCGMVVGRCEEYTTINGTNYPDLSKYKPVVHDLGTKMDFMLDSDYMSGFYAVAFDTNGKLGWKSNRIVDDDPGYGGAQIIEVLSEQVDERYLAYLEELEIPYIFAGEKEIDVELALFKLRNIVGAETLLLEGGSVINGAFQRADVIDELSLVVAPVVADKDSKPLFYDSIISDYELTNADTEKEVLVLNYKRIK